ncbi:unnamed protein product [Schistosoma margrebowiei]|uniref:WIBG Mago-binding domain-containing protein n=2 Tax=Schistosoma margrebowiei TaxID=48269 RepID=A0AA84ZPT0_9TREM|nr:unnamed protein product [Schistosoma margrebowiei]
MNGFARQGVIRDDNGNLIIPPTQRPDGTWRKAVRVKEGYIPQEEIPLYRSAGVQILEKKSQFVIPGLTKYDAEKLKLERQKQSQSDTPALNPVLKKKKSKKSKCKQTDVQSPGTSEQTELDSTKLTKCSTTSPNYSDKVNIEIPTDATVTNTENIDRQLKREHKRLLQIEEIEKKKQAGENLNKDQLIKLGHKQAVEQLIEQLTLLKTK